MAKRSSWIFGAIVAVAAFHMYSRRAEDGVALSTTATPAPVVPVPRTEPAPPQPQPRRAEPEPAPEPPVPTTLQAHRDGIEALMRGDDRRGALDLFKVARARTTGPEREDALKRLAAIERDASEKAMKARSAGALGDERAALSAAYLACLDAGRRGVMKARLDELATELVFNTRPAEGSDLYVVKPGDSLAKIAAKHNFPVDGIVSINKLKSTNLRVGERLKVPRGPVEVLVVKSEFRLVILFGGLFAREYAIGTGKDGCTPEASFAIEEKIKEPTWHSREGAFPFGHPKNILGTRWLGFNDTAEHKGFGIHGTAYPESIGKEESSGCVRMRNAEVEEVFGFVPKGATVTIVR